MGKLKQYIREVVANTTWSVSFSKNKKGDLYVCFQIYTPAGRDLCIELDLRNNDSNDAVREKLKEYYESYDVSYETYIWLDKFGHGQNGAPYELEDVLNDTKKVEELILNLYEAFKK